MTERFELGHCHGRCMNSKGAKTSHQIDLGLGAILAGPQSQKEVEVSIELPSSVPGKSVAPWSLGNDHQPAKSEFDLLADERRWAEILRRVECRVQDKGDFEARLWWIRGHLGAFSMPVSYLAAPLESLCRDIQGVELRPELRSLLEETGLLALGRLEDVGEKNLAEGLRKVFEVVGVKQSRGSGKRRRVGTSSFRSIEPAVPVAASPEIAPAERALVQATRDSRRRRFVWTCACVVIVATLLCVDRLFPHLRSPTKGVASEEFIAPPRDIELSRPIQERREPGGRLGALFYSLEGDATRSAAQPSQGVPQESTAKTQDAPVVADRAPTALVDARRTEPEAPVKEMINTAGPLEGPEFRERVERVFPADADARRGEPRREELQGGPPRAVLPEAAPHGFEHKRTYRVLESTTVLSAPSHGGRVIGHLERGDRVLVEGKLGRWLRLRSKKGRGGYVLALDVEEVPEFDDAR